MVLRRHSLFLLALVFASCPPAKVEQTWFDVTVKHPASLASICVKVTTSGGGITKETAPLAANGGDPNQRSYAAYSFTASGHTTGEGPHETPFAMLPTLNPDSSASNFGPDRPRYDLDAFAPALPELLQGRAYGDYALHLFAVVQVQAYLLLVVEHVDQRGQPVDRFGAGQKPLGLLIHRGASVSRRSSMGRQARPPRDGR